MVNVYKTPHHVSPWRIGELARRTESAAGPAIPSFQIYSSGPLRLSRISRLKDFVAEEWAYLAEVDDSPAEPQLQ